ncbi:MAG: hypothetical protein ACFFAS_09330 [Promethearchaeota archaeon]
MSVMNETIEELGTCQACNKEINLEDAWRVDEKYYCQECFDKLSI